MKAHHCDLTDSRDMPEKRDLRFVGLLDCLKELFVECLASRSTFIGAQRDVLVDSGDNHVVMKVPADVAEDWIRGLFSSPAHLRSLDDATLIRYVKVLSQAFNTSVCHRHTAHCICLA